jgi:uncharacterized membrane protein YphA (DoxX/SURF4 family)
LFSQSCNHQTIKLSTSVSALNNTQPLLVNLARVSRWGLALVFLYAGVPKLVSWYEFAEVVNSYAILPETLAIPAAIAIASLEVVAAIALILGRVEGLWAIAGLMVLFIGVLSYAIWLGLDIDCGCFGPEDPEHRAFSGIRTALKRDFLLCIPVVYLFWYRRQSCLGAVTK